MAQNFSTFTPLEGAQPPSFSSFTPLDQTALGAEEEKKRKRPTELAASDIPPVGTMGNLSDFFPETESRPPALQGQYKTVLEAPVTPEHQQLNVDRRLGYGAGPISKETEAAADAVRSGSAAQNQTVKKVARVMAKRGQPTFADSVAQAQRGIAHQTPPETGLSVGEAFVEGAKNLAFREQFGTGATGAIKTSLPSMRHQIGLQGSAVAMINNQKRLDLMDKIDSGVFSDLKALKNDPVYAAMRDDGTNLALVNSYFASRNVPDVAGKMREATTKEFQAMATDSRTHIDMLNQYAKENKEKYGPRVEKFTDINWTDPRVVADFTNWLGYNMGSGAVQMAPIMLAAVVAKRPGLLATSGAMGVSEAVGNRMKFIQDKTKGLPLEQQGAAIAKYVADTGDANLITGLISGSFDLFLGPAATAAKGALSKSIGKVGVGAAIKKAAKELPKDIGGEAVTGALQETTQIAAKKTLEEQGKPITLENIKDVINAAAAEAAGAPVGTAVNLGVGAVRNMRTPDSPDPQNRIEPSLKPPGSVNQPVTPKPKGRVEPNLQGVPTPVTPDPLGRVEPSLERTVREDVPGMVAEADLDAADGVTPIAPNSVETLSTVTPVRVLGENPDVSGPITPVAPVAPTPPPVPPAPPTPPSVPPAIVPPPTKAAESLPETPTVPPANIPKLFEPPAAQHEAREFPIVPVLVADLKLSKDVPQFKVGATDKGVVEPLTGKFTQEGTGPIAVWRRLDGSLEVISGRHRLDLAQRSKTKFINAQIYEESQGFTVAQASTLDAELNIRDEQGKVKDYVNYFKTSGTDKETAESKGLLGRVKGKRGYAIANQGSDALIAALNGDQVGDEAAYYIALNAPNNAKLQAVGVRSIMDGKSMQTAINIMEAVKTMAGRRGTNRVLWEDDQNLIEEAEAMAKIAAKMQNSIKDRLSAITGAAKNPAMAQAEGIDIRDPGAVKLRIAELEAQKAALKNWSTSPELVAQIRAASGVAAPQFELRGETPDENVAREAAEEAARLAAEEKAAADNAGDFFALQPQIQVRPEAPNLNLLAGVAPSAEYQAALELSRRATAEFGKVQEAYRKQEIGDEDFLASKKIHDDAMAAYDKALKKEQGPSDSDSEDGGSGNLLRNIEQPKKTSLAEAEDQIDGQAATREEQIQEYAKLRSKLARVPKQVSEGQTDLSMQAAVTRLMQLARDLNFTIKATKPRRDSAANFLAKAAQEFAKGNISEDVFNVIKAAYEKHPELLQGLLLSVKAGEGNTAGQFLPLARIVRLFKSTSGVELSKTFEHELAHSMEQMMTADQRLAVAQAWVKALLKAIKKNPDEKHQKYFHAVMDFIDNPSETTFRKAQGLLPSYDMYQFINPSEFWAVNAQNLMAAQLGTAWDKFKRAIARLWEGLKNVFGFDNRYVVQKTFKDIMNGSKERITKEALVDLVGRGSVQVKALGNIEDDKNLIKKHNRPATPQLDPSPTKTILVNAGKASKEFLKLAFDDPLGALGTAGNAIDRAVMYARNKNIWFGSGLNAADFARYFGQLKTSLGLATASVALDNAIRGGQIATAVVFQGGIRFDSKSLTFVATKKAKGMRGVYKAEFELKKKLGDQLGTDIIQGYLEAKRSRSIQNEFYERQANLETLKEDYEQMLESGASEKDIKVAKDALADATTEFNDIEIVFNKINMSDTEIDEFIARDQVHPELGKIMENWAAINKNMLNLWRQVGLMSEKRYEALSNIKDYVPWQRIMNDETDIHSPTQATNRTMTNIGLERVFKKGTPTVITDFKATEGQQVFKIQPAKILTVEVNGKTIDPANIQSTPEGEVRLNVPIAKGDLVVFNASREIENIIDNMTRNVTRMTMNGLRQYAAQRIVSEYATRDEKNKVMTFPKVDLERGRFSFIANGRRVVVEIQDPLIAESVIGMETLGIAMYKSLAMAANITRRAITLSGAFQIKQIFKDAPTAALVTGVKHPMLLIGGVYIGFVTSLLNIGPTVQLLKSAGIGGFQSAARTPEAEIKRRIGIMNRNVFDFLIKGLDHIGDASDMAQRVAVYNRVMAETGNEAQAMYQAANVINFLHHGSGQVAQFVVKTVPFAGAYANSIDVLAQALNGGGLKGKSRGQALGRLAVTGTLLTSMTLLYCMLVGDDEEYNQLDDQTKLRNFIIPGTKIMLPMNTSAAYFFKAIPEMLYNRVVKAGTNNAVDERRLRTALKEAAIDLLFGPTPVPSAIKPILEIRLNKDFFTGRPVVPDSVVELDAAQRYTTETSELGKLLSGVTGTTEKRLLDPIEADHLVRSLFGSAGAMAQWFSNSIGAMAGERVAPTDKQQPFIGPFLRADVPNRNEDLFYDFKERVDKKYGTYTKMVERGDFDAAAEYLDKHDNLVTSHKYTSKLGSALKKINATIRYYGESKETGLTPKERRDEITELQRLKQEVLDSVIDFREEAGL